MSLRSHRLGIRCAVQLRPSTSLRCYATKVPRRNNDNSTNTNRIDQINSRGKASIISNIIETLNSAAPNDKTNRKQPFVFQLVKKADKANRKIQSLSSAAQAANDGASNSQQDQDESYVAERDDVLKLIDELATNQNVSLEYGSNDRENDLLDESVYDSDVFEANKELLEKEVEEDTTASYDTAGPELKFVEQSLEDRIRSGISPSSYSSVSEYQSYMSHYVFQNQTESFTGHDLFWNRKVSHSIQLTINLNFQWSQRLQSGDNLFTGSDSVVFLTIGEDVLPCKMTKAVYHGNDSALANLTIFKWVTEEKISALKERNITTVGVVPCDVTSGRAMFALADIDKSKFKSYILGHPELEAPMKPEDSSLELVQKKSLPQLNESQAHAIKYALSNPMTLLKGPPGTGKTETIHQLILNCLEREREREREDVSLGKIETETENQETPVRSRNDLDPKGKIAKFSKLTTPQKEKRRHVGKKLDKAANKKRYRILVVAGSNVAIDHVTEKLVDSQRTVPVRLVASMQEKKYTPNTKVGEHCVHNVVLKNLIKKYPHRRKLFENLEGANDAQKKEMGLFVFNASFALMRKAEVILTTCAVAGSELIKRTKIDTLIMDESTQVSEPASAIPMARSDIQRIILVGDEHQLGPCENHDALNVSLFQRLITTKVFKEAPILDTQYRMHPQISSFPIKHIYGDKLKDGISANDRVLKNSPGPLVLVDYSAQAKQEGSILTDTKETSNSFSNDGEIVIVLEAVKKLINATSLSLDDIGVITPYAAQRDLLANAFQRDPIINPQGVSIQEEKIEGTGRKESAKVVNGLMVSSIDAFQGREKPVVIFSAVRSNPNGNLGFLRDPRRLNVAITRAQYSFIMIGNGECLSKNGGVWKDLLIHVKKEGNVYQVDQFFDSDWRGGYSNKLEI